MAIKIYTDGAYSSSKNQGGWAFVVLKDGIKVSWAANTIKDTTNNRMEIISVIESIKHMKNQHIDKFEIYSDSMYVVGTMTLNWKKKKNLDLWKQLDEAINKDMIIEWKHVKGHSGDQWNNYCDMLAVHASQVIIN